MLDGTPVVDLYVCSQCKATFGRPSRLKEHTRIHTGERPFVCPCGKAYARQQHLRRHQIACYVQRSLILGSSTPSTSTGSQPQGTVKKIYECSQCGAGPFRKKKMVWAHVAIVHREKKHACPDCRRAFATKSKLDRHANKHHGFSCPICSKINTEREDGDMEENNISDHDGRASPQKFENFVALRRHIAVAHPKPPLQCPTCGQRFTRPSALSEHESIHTPGGPALRRRFVCPLCLRKEQEKHQQPSATVEDSAEYQNIHQDNGYPASIVAFTAKRNLHAHMRSAHANLVFPCTWPGCPVLLSTKQKLNQHLGRHQLGQPVANESRRRRIPGSASRKDRDSGKQRRRKKSDEEGSESDSSSASQNSIAALLQQSDDELPVK
ncbi:unnamed protein product [Calicophoron daubneyi]